MGATAELLFRDAETNKYRRRIYEEASGPSSVSVLVFQNPKHPPSPQDDIKGASDPLTTRVFRDYLFIANCLLHYSLAYLPALLRPFQSILLVLLHFCPVFTMHLNIHKKHGARGSLTG